MYLKQASDCVKIKVVSTKLSLNDLLSKHSKLVLKGGELVQLFNPESVINGLHLKGAYLNALTAFKNKTNRSDSLGMEMLLFASMTNQIGDAIRICGAKSNKRLVIFASSDSAYSKISKLLTGSREFRPSDKHIKSCAKAFGLDAGRNLDSLILQKMAVSRLED